MSIAVLTDAVDPRASVQIHVVLARHVTYSSDTLAAPVLLQSFTLLPQRWATSHTQELHAYVSRAVPMGRMPCMHGQMNEA